MGHYSDVYFGYTPEVADQIEKLFEKTIGKLFVLDDDEDDDFVASISDDGKIKLWDFSVNSRNTTSSSSALLTFDGNRSNYLLDIARLANGLVSTCELGSAVEWI